MPKLFDGITGKYHFFSSGKNNYLPLYYKKGVKLIFCQGRGHFLPEAPLFWTILKAEQQIIHMIMFYTQLQTTRSNVLALCTRSLHLGKECYGWQIQFGWRSNWSR